MSANKENFFLHDNIINLIKNCANSFGYTKRTKLNALRSLENSNIQTIIIFINKEVFYGD